ncbi:MAG: radical SAM protein [Candidatus Heritagella sp.]
MENTALITDIQRCSVHDGPGIRTTVFFKGCPLHCVWCHNPECIRFEPETLYYPEKCIGCGMCDSGCYSGARVICGKAMTAGEILEQILLDKPYYGEEGGVTFSGGEALSQPAIVKEVIALCKKEGIHTAIETSLFPFDPDLLGSLDLVMADFKIWDDDRHRKYTGVSNRRIKENFQKLDRLNVPFLVRTPLIPGITDTPENIGSIRDFIRGFQNLLGYELLPYNPLGDTKRRALGQEPVSFGQKARDPKELERYADLQRQTGRPEKNQN